jgi:hypothetical protein
VLTAGATPDACYIQCSLLLSYAPLPFYFAIVGPDAACVCSLTGDVIYDATATV